LVVLDGQSEWVRACTQFIPDHCVSLPDTLLCAGKKRLKPCNWENDENTDPKQAYSI